MRRRLPTWRRPRVAPHRPTANKRATIVSAGPAARLRSGAPRPRSASPIGGTRAASITPNRAKAVANLIARAATAPGRNRASGPPRSAAGRSEAPSRVDRRRAVGGRPRSVQVVDPVKAREPGWPGKPGRPAPPWSGPHLVVPVHHVDIELSTDEPGKAGGLCHLLEHAGGQPECPSPAPPGSDMADDMQYRIDMPYISGRTGMARLSSRPPRARMSATIQTPSSARHPRRPHRRSRTGRSG